MGPVIVAADWYVWRVQSNSKKTIYESFKVTDNFIVNLEKLSNKSTLEFYDSKNEKIILRFY